MNLLLRSRSSFVSATIQYCISSSTVYSGVQFKTVVLPFTIGFRHDLLADNSDAVTARIELLVASLVSFAIDFGQQE